MKIRKILEQTNLSPTQKWLLRKKKVECTSCGAINYEEDLRNVDSGYTEAPYSVCPDCGHHELDDYTDDDRCPNCDAAGFDGEECKDCGWN